MISRLRTPLCDLLGIDVPIVGAGMGGLAGAELAAAISSAGALGVIGAGGDSTETVIERLRDARALTSSPLGVNVVLEVVPAERVRAVLDEGVDVLVTGWGDPGAWSGACRERGTLLAHRVENAAEAVRAVAAGADVLIAQGSDAGGHTGSVPSLALIPCVVDVARSVPVLAAGGVADGRGPRRSSRARRGRSRDRHPLRRRRRSERARRLRQSRDRSRRGRERSHRCLRDRLAGQTAPRSPEFDDRALGA